MKDSHIAVMQLPDETYKIIISDNDNNNEIVHVVSSWSEIIKIVTEYAQNT